MTAHLLFVDDEGDMLDMLREEAYARGYAVDCAQSGDAALETLRLREFDAVVSDIRMPGIDGLAVLRAVREMWPETEVIIATGYASLEAAVECLRSGAFDFVEKPCHMEELFTTIARAIERRKLREQTSLYETCQLVFAGSRGGASAEALPERIVELSMKVMSADDVSLMLPDAEGNLYVACSHGMPTAVRGQTKLAIGERVAGRVAADKTPVILQSTLDSDPRFAGLESFRPVKSSIVYPLLAGSCVMGVLNLNRVGKSLPFRAWDLQRVTVLASQVVLALENSQLIRRLVQSERLAAVGQIAAGVAHEINNPISYVLTSLSEVTDGIRDLSKLKNTSEVVAGKSVAEVISRLNEAASDALEGAGRIRDIVRDMRALAHSGEDVPVEFDLNEAVRSAARVTAAQVRGRAIMTLSLGEDLYVRGNSGRLAQVVMNLVVNAVHALDVNRRATNRVTISSRADAVRAIVEVSDNGCGIPTENFERIFDPFFTTKPVGMGTGLGLSISREIIRRFGGDISVASQVGNGSCFTISLPLADLKSGTHPVSAPPSRNGQSGEALLRRQ